MRYAGVIINLNKIEEISGIRPVLRIRIDGTARSSFKKEEMVVYQGIADRDKITEYKGISIVYGRVWDQIYFIIPETHHCFNLFFLATQQYLRRAKGVEAIERPFQQYFYDNYIKPIKSKL
jgi:hypothetical protein